MIEKVCSRCKILKPIEEFYKIKKGEDLRVPHCKICQKGMLKKYLSTDSGRKKIQEQFKKRYKNNTSEYIKKATKRHIEKPKEVWAASKARQELKKGIIAKTPCVICGEKKVDMHHVDYESPLKVTCLCRSCHVKEHIKINKLLKRSN